MNHTFTIPFPPSVNTYWRHPSTGKLAGRTLISEAGRRYRDAIMAQAVAENWPEFDEEARLKVEIEAWMPDRRRRDLDNVLKAALDSMTYTGLWPDDSHIDELRITRVPTIGGMLKIKVEALQALEESK